MSNKIIIGDCREVLKGLPDNSVHCCVTSPPYFRLRSYLPKDHPDKNKEIGQEQTPEEYISNLVGIFHEVKRVLRDDSTLWLNISDTYKNNQMLGIPWKLAFALQSDGWLLIQDIIWTKNNCLPESVTRRCTRSHEYLFLFAKSKKYFYDNEAIKEPAISSDNNVRDRDKGKLNNVPGRGRMQGLKTNRYSSRNKRSVWLINNVPYTGSHFACFPPTLVEQCIKAGTSEHGVCSECGAPFSRILEKEVIEIEGEGNFGANGSKWKDEDKQSSGHRIQKNFNALRAAGRDHDNPFPQKITIGWKPSCSCNSGISQAVVLDPFGGSGTVGQWCNQNNRNSILIELNPEYKPLIEERINSKPKSHSKKRKVSPVEKFTLQQNLIQYFT